MKTKEELYNHLFYTLRKYMLIDSIYNQYDDAVLYWSYDTEQFLKRHERNKKHTYNWFVIPHDKHLMYHIKHVLKLEDKNHITQTGRLIWNGSWEQDDTWKLFKEYVDNTFKNFYDIYNKQTLQTKINIKNEKSKPLF